MSMDPDKLGRQPRSSLGDKENEFFIFALPIRGPASG